MSAPECCHGECEQGRSCPRRPRHQVSPTALDWILCGVLLVVSIGISAWPYIEEAKAVDRKISQ